MTRTDDKICSDGGNSPEDHNDDGDIKTLWIVVYLLMIGLTIFIQAVVNYAIHYVALLLQEQVIIQMIVIIYLILIGFIIDFLLWAQLLIMIGIFDDFWNSLFFVSSAFTVSHSIDVPEDYEFVYPALALNGVLLIAFAGAYLFTIVYETNKHTLGVGDSL